LGIAAQDLGDGRATEASISSGQGWGNCRVFTLHILNNRLPLENLVSESHYVGGTSIFVTFWVRQRIHERGDRAAGLHFVGEGARLCFVRRAWNTVQVVFEGEEWVTVFIFCRN
jgi:hypothetical protein